jgi:hypothetical protein
MSQHIEWLTIADKDFTLTPGQWTDGDSRNDGPALWFGDSSGDGAIVEAPSRAALISHLEHLIESIKAADEPEEPAKCVHCGVPVHHVPVTMAQEYDVWEHQHGSSWYPDCYDWATGKTLPGGPVATPPQ